ncbi:Fc.00g051410.m01.CDS01 [Cosmosporella sp. VM-42]
MGMHGPLTAQALGRSPYDDVVERDDEQDGNAQETTQQFDHRGRPVNPETKRINRDIIRSHNEVMLVIGVAEPEFPNAGPEVESEIRHEAYEENVGMVLASMASRCIETVGVFGVHGLRQRILIYKRYSEIPFWGLYQAARKDFSFTRDVLPGVPSSLLSNYLERHMAGLWAGRMDRIFARQFVHEIWAYLRVHLELFVATQRLGLVPGNQLLPPLSYFIPCTDASPIPAPPPLADLTPLSMLQWVGGLCISATPFLVWVMAQRMTRDCKPQIWQQVYKRLPTTRFLGKKIPPPPPPPTGVQPVNDGSRSRLESSNNRGSSDEVSPLRAVDGQLPSDAGPVEAVRRPSTFSARGDDYASDEDENEGVSATLISFDVEATTDSTDAPPGLWSAELRPSVPDVRGSTSRVPLYHDTLLTQLPALIASQMFGDAVTRILMAPYEATALRLVARTIRLRQGLDCFDIFKVSLLSGLSWASVINLLGAEFMHLLITGEVFAAFTSITQYFHMTQDEWKAEEGNDKSSSSWWDF